MKLTAFRIRNFRSIVDTGWQFVSPDNITCLIGQNESGKTSVLEGLNVFHTGHITEDVLRSDLSLPEISCRFSVSRGSLLDVTINPGTELSQLLIDTDTLELTRFWLADFTSGIKVGGVLSDYLESLEDAWRLYLGEVSVKLNRVNRIISERRERLTEIESQKKNLEVEIKGLERQTAGSRFFKMGKKGDSLSSPKIDSLKKELSEIIKAEGQLRREETQSADLDSQVSLWDKLQEELTETDRELESIAVKLEERHQILTLLMRPDDYNESSWEEIIAGYQRLRGVREEIAEKLDTQTALCGFLMDGDTPESAMQKVLDIKGKYKSKLTGEMLGSCYFEYTPVFSMFEDFGSLLPNRIDLDVIMAGDDKVEGYKAARNFLALARLEHSFFLQPSSRILKQTIENLNHKLTRNFHDFWQQSVGSRNKIKIQFELEHYSESHGDKSGKPYLEFWIKDEGERLYPKQRSRGVRWFLSFYLELMASAESGKKPIVLLVDEPGVSLHARAQEDVLKVFEDISNRIHVIYTTHSPHLVDINKLHRVLAVQRDDVESYKSATRIIDPVLLAAASPDTLTPIHSVMGNPFGAGFSDKRHNLIVSNTGTFYFLSAILGLTGYKGKMNIVPSTDVTSIPLLCNIMMGWGLNYSVLVFGNDEEKKIAAIISSTVIREGNPVAVSLPDSFQNIEDMFSTLDFKKHVLKNREGITVPNSEYINDNSLPRVFLASRLLSAVRGGDVKPADFDEETLENFRVLNQLLSDKR
jgi:hypothetical protein